MAEVDANAMEGVIEGDNPVPAPALEESPPPEVEYTSETLYIQNLNEKIKVPGHTIPSVFRDEKLNLFTQCSRHHSGDFSSHMARF
jgi:hypothetical protein